MGGGAGNKEPPVNPPTKFALMRANRPKLALARKIADDIEAQRMAGVEVNILLTPAQPCGSSRDWHWWSESVKVPAGTTIDQKLLQGLKP